MHCIGMVHVLIMLCLFCTIIQLYSIYYSEDHLVSVIVTLLFIVFPTLLLILYPTRIFRKHFRDTTRMEPMVHGTSEEFLHCTLF